MVQRLIFNCKDIFHFVTDYVGIVLNECVRFMENLLFFDTRRREYTNETVYNRKNKQ